eukprot:9013592-Karenia_brevis.AAC.1
MTRRDLTCIAPSECSGLTLGRNPNSIAKRRETPTHHSEDVEISTSMVNPHGCGDCSASLGWNSSFCDAACPAQPQRMPALSSKSEFIDVHDTQSCWMHSSSAILSVGMPTEYVIDIAADKSGDQDSPGMPDESQAFRANEYPQFSDIVLFSMTFLVSISARMLAFSGMDARHASGPRMGPDILHVFLACLESMGAVVLCSRAGRNHAHRLCREWLHIRKRSQLHGLSLCPRTIYLKFI